METRKRENSNGADVKSSLESILFLHGDPVAVSRLAKILGAGKAEIEKALAELQEEYRERGIVLIENRDEWQFATNPKNKDVVERFVTADLAEDLTRASLETIAIIAYKGPVSRANIEYIRGVNSSFTVRNLLVRGLVEREENPSDRRSYLYRVSSDFLKHLGLTRLEELPQYKEFRAKEVAIPGDPNDAGESDAARGEPAREETPS